MDFYQENGPTFCLEAELLKPAQSIFQLQGFWLKLVAMGVPHGRMDRASLVLREEWVRTQAKNRAMAATGLTVAETLRYLHDPNWVWTPGFYKEGM